MGSGRRLERTPDELRKIAVVVTRASGTTFDEIGPA
jgi:hypothetical protein